MVYTDNAFGPSRRLTYLYIHFVASFLLPYSLISGKKSHFYELTQHECRPGGKGVYSPRKMMGMLVVPFKGFNLWTVTA